MLHVNTITLRVAGHPLLEDATLHVPAGHRIGLVGRNGSGKTSFLRLLAGELQPDAGSIRLQRGASVGMIAQEAPGGASTPLETVMAADRERATLIREAETATDPHRIAEIQDRLADIGAHTAVPRAAAILDGLGFDEAAQQRPLSSFSGGWRMRVALASVLFTEPDLLLLDEPTNHLDLEATVWLEAHLRSYPRTLIIVSHDRDLLNRIPQSIVHLDQRRFRTYAGGYDSFERTRREQLELEEKLRARQEAERRHIQSFIDRFRYKASKARQAQSRIKALARMEPIPEAALDPEIRLDFPDVTVPPPPLITLDGVAVGYGGRVVLGGLDMRIDPEDRIALLGANGNGKSTFARLIAGRLEPMAGEMVRARGLRVGYFAQHQIEELEPDRTALDHMARCLPDAREELLRPRLGGFGLGLEKAERRAAQLSGGEKARLTLALISIHDPHIVVLDEPTNHLDIDSRQALVEAINAYAGAVIIVSHDRHLVELTADLLWLVAGGRVTRFDGDLDDYRERLLAERAAAARTADAGDRQRSPDRARPAARRAKLAPLRQAARNAEREIEELSAEKARLEAQLARPETYGDGADRVPDLVRRQKDLDRLIAAAEARWLKAEAAIESLAG